MNAPPLGPALLLWCAMLVLAVGNGMLREFVSMARLGWSEPRAHVAHTLLFLALAVPLMAVFTLSLRVPAGGPAWTLGALWAVLTVAFELLFGRYVGKHSWSRLLADYDLTRGRVWALVPLALLLTAPVAARLAA